ncbi:MAG: type II toxin-antitoxin system VapB family antitoxin [Acidimicrobiales bacterium]
MAKRKITVTIDEELVEQAHRLGKDTTLSGLVNQALSVHVERLGRLAALREVLDAWESSYGPTSVEATLAAKGAFDELDALGDATPAPGTGRGATPAHGAPAASKV